MDEAGQLLPPGSTGEVVIRGPNVTTGYENNPEANAAGFTQGWFRTGDQGRFDAENYLSLTGRLKEIINRGGEKVSPLEVDGVLSAHPAIAQVVTFAITGGRDQSQLTIDADSGALNFVTPPDYETPGDADRNNIYEVVVTASDGVGGTATQSIAVTVNPAEGAEIT